MKFISFNINGVRAHFHQLKSIIEQHNPDVIGLQETRIHDEIFPFSEIAKLGYNVFCHGRKGYHGVALLTKKKLVTVRCNFTSNNEAPARIIIVELLSPIGDLRIINGYFPQGENRNHSTKFSEKKRFYLNLQQYLENEMKNDSPLLIMGDMNISPTDLDIGIGEKNRKRWLHTGKCSFLPEERMWMQNLLDWGLVDTFRSANPEVQDRFSWFDYRSRGFENNRGLRIDLILVSLSLSERCIETGIDYKIRGMERPSDHAPIWAKFIF